MLLQTRTYAYLPGRGFCCYLDPSSLSKSTQASENSLGKTPKKKKIIILYVVNKVIVKNKDTNGNGTPTEQHSQLKASSKE